MSYGYYQQQPQPGWGTNHLSSPKYRFGPPPPPNFQSQSTWGGMDFYRAHAISPDPHLFDHAWNRVRDPAFIHQPGGSIGVAIHEARHWHRRAYGGIGQLALMLPTEIGNAAAYEAYRTWIHNSSIYEPLSGDIHRQREALIGLAVAEASRLLHHAGRHMDRYASTTAAEAAAATASIIFLQNNEGHDTYHRGRSRSRSRYETSGSYDSYSDPYAEDDAIQYSRHGQRRSLHRSRSHARHLSIPVPNAAAEYYGGYPHSGYASSVPNGSSSNYGGGTPPYGSYSSEGAFVSAHGTPYPHPPPSVTHSHSGSFQYPSAPLNFVPHGSSPMPYPQSHGYIPAANNMLMPGTALPQTIVLHKSYHKKHKHHRRHSRSRSRSHSRDRDRSRSRRSRSSDHHHYRRHGRH